MAFRDGDEHVTSVLYPPVSGFWTWDVAKDVVYGDANLGDYFGLTRDEFLHGASLGAFLSCIEGQDRDRVSASIKSAVRSREPFRERYTLHSPSRGKRTISAVGRCYYDSTGAAALFPGWFVDVTDAQTSRITALRTAEHHVEQAKVIIQSMDEDLLLYMLEMTMTELTDALARTARSAPP